MIHSFNIELAEKYGIEESVIIQHFDFWLSHNKANGKNLHDNTYWTFNSARAFSKIFPYMSAAKIRRVLIKLEEKNIIRIDNFNKLAYDRTQWYTFTDAFCKSNKSILQFCKMEDTEMQNGLDENVEPIPDDLPDLFTDDLPEEICSGLTVDEQFEEFWKVYPRKVSKAAAKKAFEKLMKSKNKVEVSVLINSVKLHAKQPGWKKDNGQYIPHASTWLNQLRWQDELPEIGGRPIAKKTELEELMGM